MRDKLIEYHKYLRGNSRIKSDFNQDGDMFRMVDNFLAPAPKCSECLKEEIEIEGMCQSCYDFEHKIHTS